MTHDEAFLADIAEHPDDDVPRLIYADWLDDHGEELRAELIRVQCEAERTDPATPRGTELTQRERELVRAYTSECAPAFAPWVEGWTLRRGLLERVTVQPSRFLDHAETLFRYGPVNEVVLGPVDSREALHQLLRSPHLARVRTLGLTSCDLRADDVAVLVKDGPFTQLRSLSLADNGIGPDALGLLLAAPFTPRLRALDLSRNPLGVNGVEAIAGCAALAGLVALRLDRTGMGVPGAQLLTSSRHLGTLEHLSIASNQLPGTSLRSLSGDRLRGLRHLILRDNPLGDDGARQLARVDRPPQLAFLDLDRTGLTAGAAAALAESPLLGGLKHLELGGNRLGVGGVTALARSRYTPVLSHLGLAGNELGDEGGKALAGWPALAGLVSLHLGTNGLRAFGLKEVVDSPHLGPVRDLDLHGNRLGDVGAQVLARWKGLARLDRLNLRNNRIGATGAAALAASAHLHHLAWLDLSANDIEGDAALAFTASDLCRRIDTCVLD